MATRGFVHPLSEYELGELKRRAHLARGRVLTATTLAQSGHPGGSFSSMELYTVLYGCARIRPDEPRWPGRDRIVVSHGHTSPGVYAALASTGFFPAEEFAAHFRQAGSVFEGHVERSVPGVEWSTGNLGQGLSAGVGMALAARALGADWRAYVAMSDAEQHKGQVAEARRLAAKEHLSALTVVVDLNGIQISGHTKDIMPVNVADDFAADGWNVIEVDGHDVLEIYDAIRQAHAHTGGPSAVIAHTLIGKPVSFMEDQAEYHGRALTLDEYGRAMAELGLDPGELDEARAMRTQPCAVEPLPHRTPAMKVAHGTPRTYASDVKTDNRSAWGAALVDLADANPGVPMAVLDCDLETSVKTDGFAATRPESFLECGVGEHNAAMVAGAMSISDVLTFWADFGVFGLDEVYNQQRLNDINGAAVKLALTHCGLDVGEDGKTHQCIDYVGAFKQFFGWRVIVPADPNQTDRAVRAAAAMQGNVAVAMGRSKLPIVTAADGSTLFGGTYEFEYGRIEWAREGRDACVLGMGTTVGGAVAAADDLRTRGKGDVAVGVVACPLDLDDAAMVRVCDYPFIVTVEDHNARTGLGASVAEWLIENRMRARLLRLGVEDYQSSGAGAELLERAGLDKAGIVSVLERELG